MEQRNAITAENHNFLKDVGPGFFTMQMIKRQQLNINDEDVDVDNSVKVVDQVVVDQVDVDQVDVD